MSVQNNLKTLLATLGAVVALSSCGGADEVASPGEGAFPPPPTTAPPPAPPPPPGAGQPAADCPATFIDDGTILDRSGAILRVCRFPQIVTGNLVVSRRAGTIYSASGRTDFGQDRGGDFSAPIGGVQSALVTLEAGVKIFGSGGLDYIVVNRGSQLIVQGTATDPVIMTSKQSVEGTTGVDSIGQWGGLLILGRAPISTCEGVNATPGTAGCQARVEGSTAYYGGNNPTDDSGSIRYLRIQHSGFQVAPDQELNGITLAGVGNGTTFEYVQVHNSSDDGIEWFGGTVNARYLVLTGNDDDSIDTDAGFNGAIQFALVVQRANGGDRMNEMSALNRAPFSNPKIANATFVGNSLNGVGLLLNQSTNVQYYNSVVTRPDGATGAGRACLDVDDASGSGTTTGSFDSVFFSCPVAFDDDADGAAAAIFNAGTNNTANGTSTLTTAAGATAAFVNGDNESAVPAFGSLPTVSPFFQQVDYIGAVRDANDTWWKGWTCGLTTDTPC